MSAPPGDAPAPPALATPPRSAEAPLPLPCDSGGEAAGSRCADSAEAECCPYCLEAAGARIRAPCRCRGSLELVHEECLRHDLAANHRNACSVCHEPYEIQHDITERTLLQRTRAALQAAPLYMATVTFTSASLAGLFFFIFSCFERGGLPLASFPVRDPAGAEYSTLGLGVGCVVWLAVAWRGAVVAQPAAELRRTLMSTPDSKGRRMPLLSMLDEEGPAPPGWRPAQEAARRASAREARLAAAHAAFATHGGTRPSLDEPLTPVQRVQAVAELMFPFQPRPAPAPAHAHHGEEAV